MHARKIDIWAAGVFLYRLLTGVYPFDGEGVMEIKDQLLEDPVNYSMVDPMAVNLLKKMLEKNPLERATIE